MQHKEEYLCYAFRDLTKKHNVHVQLDTNMRQVEINIRKKIQFSTDYHRRIKQQIQNFIHREYCKAFYGTQKDVLIISYWIINKWLSFCQQLKHINYNITIEYEELVILQNDMARLHSVEQTQKRFYLSLDTHQT